MYTPISGGGLRSSEPIVVDSSWYNRKNNKVHFWDINNGNFAGSLIMYKRERFYRSRRIPTE